MAAGTLRSVIERSARPVTADAAAPTTQPLTEEEDSSAMNHERGNAFSVAWRKLLASLGTTLMLGFSRPRAGLTSLLTPAGFADVTATPVV